jgi:hypothetical protein
MNGLGQGQMQDAGAQAAMEPAREVNLSAVRDDAVSIQDNLSTLDETIQKLQEHLMGAQPMLTGGDIEKAAERERPSPSGMLPVICSMGSSNIRHLNRIQERLNQLCYELGEGR